MGSSPKVLCFAVNHSSRAKAKLVAFTQHNPHHLSRGQSSSSQHGHHHVPLMGFIFIANLSGHLLLETQLDLLPYTGTVIPHPPASADSSGNL